MNTWTVSGIVEVGALAIMLLSVIGVITQRLVSGMGLGARAIQFLAVGLLFPILLILALEKAIASETTAALLGGLAGYLLSDVGKYEPKEATNKSDKDKTEEPQRPAAG